MSKRKAKDPFVEALQEGCSFTFALPDGGAFASMRMVSEHGQSLTFSPVTNDRDVEVGDIVLDRWRGGGYVAHSEQHPCRVLKHVKRATDSGGPEPIIHLVNHGKEHVGQVGGAWSV